MEFQKIVNFIDTTSDNKDLPRYVTKKWVEVYDQSQENYNTNKEHQIYVILVMHILLLKEILLLLKKHLLLMILKQLIKQ